MATAQQTVYTLPQQVDWKPGIGKGLPTGSFEAVLRGKPSDNCGKVFLIKFPDRFFYPWHVNHYYALYAILKGTLVIGFNKKHLRSAERALPAGSFVQGVATKPHYARAIGETIFQIVAPCPVPH